MTNALYKSTIYLLTHTV